MNQDEVKMALARVEAKLDSLLSRHETHEDRIHDLEKSRNWLWGAFAALGAVWTYLMKVAIPK